MPQSLVKNYIHLIFSTKRREKKIRIEDYGNLRAFLTGILSSIGCYLIEFGSTENHVHILMVLNKNVSMSNMVGKVKANTSRWIRQRNGNEFSWQEGYGAFSVSQMKVDVVQQYIQNQIEQHKKKSFEDEYREFFKAYGIDWDEKYVWD